MDPGVPSLLRAATRGPWNLWALPGALPWLDLPQAPVQGTEPECQWSLSLRPHPTQPHQGFVSGRDSRDAECGIWQSCATLRPHGLSATRHLCPWNFPSKNTGVGCHALLQGCWILKFRCNRNHNRKHMCLPQQAVSYDGQRQGPAQVSINSKWTSNHKPPILGQHTAGRMNEARLCNTRWANLSKKLIQ